VNLARRTARETRKTGRNKDDDSSGTVDQDDLWELGELDEFKG
jgi:hypothetical protein